MAMMILFCTILCIIIGLYAHTKVLAHLIYIPITLATIWWGNKGISVGAGFGIMLIIISLTFENGPTLTRALLIAVTFIAVGFLVGRLSGERELERALCKLKGKAYESRLKEANEHKPKK